MWEKDEILSKYKNDLNKYKCISFDIFDTLILRAVDNPQDVFLKLGYKIIEDGCVRKNLSPYEFKQIRILSEKKAFENSKTKKCNNELDNEVTLNDIYNEMPCNLGNIDRIKNFEIEIEKQYTYLNPVIYDFMKYLKSRGKRIFLISNMYLNKKILKEILLVNNFEYSLIEDIIVSCDVSLNKTSGKLFEYVSNKYNIENNEILHIGDNYDVDIQGAKRAKIDAIKYDLSVCENTFIDMEKYKYGYVLPELKALRKVCINLTNNYNDDEKFWFKFGISVIGPFLTLFSDYIIENAINYNTKIIKPFMREAVILESMIKRAAEYRKYKCDIKPLYISRLSTLLPSINKISPKSLDEIFEIKNVKLKDAAEILGLKVQYIMIYNIYFNDYCSHIDKGTLNSINQYILKNYEDKINRYIKKKRNIFIEYLMQEGINNRNVITVDLGFAGSIQEKLQNILEEESININISHFIALSSDKLYTKLQKGLDIECFTGIYEENVKLNDIIIDKVMLLEELMMDERGSTIGYIKNNDCIEPVLGENKIPKLEFKYKKICRDGMEMFQKLYYKCLGEKYLFSQSNNRKKELLNMITRFMTVPTYEESINLSKLYHEDNFGTSSIEQACKIDEFKLYEKLNNTEKFLFKAKYSKIMWPEAIVTINNPKYFEKKIYNESEYMPRYYKEVFETIENLKAQNVKDIIVWGAGEIGRICVSFLKNNEFNVCAVVDRKEWLHNTTIEDVLISSAKDVSEHYKGTKVNVLIASIGFISEIKNSVNEYFEDPDIYTII